MTRGCRPCWGRQREAPIHLGAGSLAYPPQPHIDHVVPVVGIEHLERVQARPLPRFPQLVPVPTHVIVPVYRSDIVRNRRWPPVDHVVVASSTSSRFAWPVAPI